MAIPPIPGKSLQPILFPSEAVAIPISVPKPISESLRYLKVEAPQLLRAPTLLIRPRNEGDLVLIANRAGIARLADSRMNLLGMRAGVVYSDPDGRSDAVRFSDVSVHLRGRTSEETYINQDRVIQAALRAGAIGIYPGYGFVSENPAFARRVREAGLVWFGPAPETMEIMASKALAMDFAEKNGVPVAPHSPVVQNEEEAVRWAQEIGLPIAVKADAGGGGRGFFPCHTMDEVRANYQKSAAIGQSAFGSSAVTIMKLLTRPRHIEFQVIGFPPKEEGGKPEIHVFEVERDCTSCNPRGQKFLEETGNGLHRPPAERARIVDSVRKMAEACGYVGLGTWEFLDDLDSGVVSFMEVNARGQVEIGITDRLFGVNCVSELLRMFSGLPRGSDFLNLIPRGHVMQLRVNAENPTNLAPAPGQFRHLRWAQVEGVEVHSGYSARSIVSDAYDSNVALAVIVGANRDECLERGWQFVRETTWTGDRGLLLNLPFLGRVLEEPGFKGGDRDSWNVNSARALLATPSPVKPRRPAAMVAVAVMRYQEEQSTMAGRLLGNPSDRRTTVRPSDVPRSEPKTYVVNVEGCKATLLVAEVAPNLMRVELAGGDSYFLRTVAAPPLNTLCLCVGKTEGGGGIEEPIRTTVNFLDGESFRVLIDGEIYDGQFVTSANKGVNPSVYSPMPGKLLEVRKKVGDSVVRGEIVAVVEAMKMQNELMAVASGEVISVSGQVGKAVSAQELLVEVKSSGGSSQGSAPAEGDLSLGKKTVDPFDCGPGGDPWQYLAPLRHALMGFDGQAMNDTLLGRLENLRKHLEAKTLPLDEARTIGLAAIHSLLETYTDIQSLSEDGLLHDAFVGFVRNIDRLNQPEQLPDIHLSRTLLRLMRPYDFEIPGEADIRSEPEALIGAVSKDLMKSRNFYLRLFSVVMHG